MRRLGRRQAQVVALLVVLALGAALSGCNKAEKTEGESVLPVSVATVTKGTVQKVSTYTATLRGVREASVVPRTSARVVEVRVRPGDKVSQGQVLMVLDSKDFAGSLAAAQASADSARKNLERMTELLAQGAVSQQQYDAARTTYEVAAAQLASAQAAASNSQITSPISGTVGVVYLKVGDTANPASPAVVVSDLSALEVEIAVSEGEISHVALGNEAQVYVEAVSDQPFKGKIAAISPVADARTKCYPVRIQLTGDVSALKSGMFARASLATERRENAITVPVEAVAEQGARRVVYVVEPDNKVREVEVEIGIAGEKNLEIVKGLKAGDKVVVKGQTLLHDGDKVKVVGGGAV